MTSKLKPGDRIEWIGFESGEVYQGVVTRVLAHNDTWWVKPDEPWAEVREDSFPEVFDGIPIKASRMRVASGQKEMPL